MADNVDITPGAGKTVRSEEIGGIQHQWVVPVWGPPGTVNRTDVASGKPFPVQARDSVGAEVLGLLTASPDANSIAGRLKAAVDAITAGTIVPPLPVGLVVSALYQGTTALTPKYAVIAASSSGNNTLVAAVASKKIRVHAYNFIANGGVNAKFQSGAGGTDLTGLKYATQYSGLVAPFNPVGWFETATNTLLNLNLSGAVAVGGELVYSEVT